jgi:hypothetical protein
MAIRVAGSSYIRSAEAKEISLFVGELLVAYSAFFQSRNNGDATSTEIILPHESKEPYPIDSSEAECNFSWRVRFLLEEFIQIPYKPQNASIARTTANEWESALKLSALKDNPLIGGYYGKFTMFRSFSDRGGPWLASNSRNETKIPSVFLIAIRSDGRARNRPWS